MLSFPVNSKNPQKCKQTFPVHSLGCEIIQAAHPALGQGELPCPGGAQFLTPLTIHTLTI